MTALGVILGSLEILFVFGMFYYGVWNLVKLSIKKVTEVMKNGVKNWEERNVYNKFLHR